MSRLLVYGAASIAVLCLGLYALATRANLLRKIIAINVMGSAVFLLFVVAAYRNRGDFADPVPHALVLTGIVVAVAITGLGLGLARRIHAETGRMELSEEEGLE